MTFCNCFFHCLLNSNRHFTGFTTTKTNTALTIANQDAAFAGDLCLRCHAPVGWLEGRSTPTDGSHLADIDYEGVSCNFCHRSEIALAAKGVDFETVDIDLVKRPDWYRAKASGGSATRKMA